MKLKYLLSVICITFIYSFSTYGGVGEGISDVGTLSSIYSITVTYPNTRVNLIMGQQYEIKWIDNIAENVNIILLKAGVKVKTISKSTESDGNFMWAVPLNLTPGSDYKIRISSKTNRSVKDDCDKKFEISSPKLEVALGNFPNPFNPLTVIKYSIPFDADVTLVVYNTLGEVVADLVNQTQLSGIYEAEFNGSGLASGIYIYQLTAQDIEGKEEAFNEIKKMILLK